MGWRRNQKLICSKQRKGDGEIRRLVYTIWLKKDEFCGIIEKNNWENFSMKIEFIVEGDNYQQFTQGIVPVAKEGVTFFSENKKIAGANNFLLSVWTFETNMTSAKMLSEFSEQIKGKFIENQIKFYMLEDGPSTVFVTKLYPLVCEFETKLRKFVYLTLFDLDEPATQIAVTKIKTTTKELKSITNIPSNNFLENITLGNLFDFLFDNNEFTEEAKKKTSTITNDIGRTATKAELIAIIDAIEEKTIWNTLFAKTFPDFSLPRVYRELFPLRNDVMHFHSVTYKTYRKALNLFKNINKELDAQIEKGVVLENTAENAELISSQYFNTVLSELRDSINILKSNFDVGTMSALREILKSIQMIRYDVELDAVTSFMKAFRDTLPKEDISTDEEENIPELPSESEETIEE